MLELKTIRRRLRKHRHLVVVPLALVLVTLTIRQGFSGAGAVGQLVSASDGSIAVGTMTGLLPDGGKVLSKADGLYLDHGTLVVASQGLGRVTAGGSELLGWKGAYQVSWENEVLSVAALTTPVLVKDGEHVTVVPVGSQWKAPATWRTLEEDPAGWLEDRSVLPLPAHFLRDRFTLVQSMPKPEFAESATEDDEGGLLDAMKLPEARRRSAESARAALLTHVLRDPTAASDVSTDSRFEYALAEASFSMLGDLAAAVPSGIGSDKILEAFLRHEDGLLLASFHPLLRDRAWILGEGTDISNPEVRLLLLPQLDTAEDAMIPIAADRWMTAFTTYLGSREDASAVLSAWMPVATRSVARFAAQGLPIRAKTYADSVRVLAAPYERQVGSEHLSELSSAESYVADSQTENAEEEEAPAQPVLTSAAAQMVEEKALGWVREAGASMTVSTAVTALDAHRAQVDGLVFPTAKGDKQAGFAIDIETGEISAIRHDGQELPFSMPFDGFTNWVKEGMEVTGQ